MSRFQKEKPMKSGWFFFLPGLLGAAVLAGVALTTTLRDGEAIRAREVKKTGPRVVLAETYNAVTKIHFTNVAVHKGSPNPNRARRRFRADVKYWLMDARYYDRGELSVGNPPLVDFVCKLGSKDLPANKPTTLPAMAYGIARAVLERFPIIQKVEVRLVHFSRGLKADAESEDNHVVTVVVGR
jgi:hypothetical protein